MFDYKKHFLYLGTGGGGDEPDTPNFPTPVTSIQQYMYVLAGHDLGHELPTPVTAEEHYWYSQAASLLEDDTLPEGGTSKK